MQYLSEKQREWDYYHNIKKIEKELAELKNNKK